MEEGIAPAVAVEAVVQILPGADLVHRLVGDDLLEQ